MAITNNVVTKKIWLSWNWNLGLVISTVESVSLWLVVKSNSGKTFVFGGLKNHLPKRLPLMLNDCKALRERFDSSVCHDVSQQLQPLGGFG